jgi:hypothetical protein
MRIQPAAVRTVQTVSELALLLNVDVRAISYVELAQIECASSDCIFPSAVGNGAKCILCQQSWYPREYNDKGKRVKYTAEDTVFLALSLHDVTATAEIRLPAAASPNSVKRSDTATMACFVCHKIL